MPDCCALKDIWRQLLTLIFHQTFNFKINMRQQCDFNEMQMPTGREFICIVGIQFFQKGSMCPVFYEIRHSKYFWLWTFSSWQERKESMMTFSLSAQCWKIGCIFLWWHTKIYHSDIVSLIHPESYVYFHVKKFFLCVMFWIYLTSKRG